MDERDVNALMMELDSDPGYGEGTVPFPRPLSPGEAATMAVWVHKAVDRVAELRASAAETAGTPLACRAGCSYCCEQMVMVPAPEVLLVAGWLAAPEQAAAREAFLAAYPRWRHQVGSTPERMADATARGDRRGHMAVTLQHFRKRILCAFNRDGLCSIYPVRPAVCRQAHAVGDPEACRIDSPAPAQRFDFVPLEGVVRRSNNILCAAHHAVGGPVGRPASLCVAVRELLVGKDTKDVGRNDPCPCGSGKKHKRCCGAAG